MNFDEFVQFILIIICHTLKNYFVIVVNNGKQSFLKIYSRHSDAKNTLKIT